MFSNVETVHSLLCVTSLFYNKKNFKNIEVVHDIRKKKYSLIKIFFKDKF